MKPTLKSVAESISKYRRMSSTAACRRVESLSIRVDALAASVEVVAEQMKAERDLVLDRWYPHNEHR